MRRYRLLLILSVFLLILIIPLINAKIVTPEIEQKIYDSEELDIFNALQDAYGGRNGPYDSCYKEQGGNLLFISDYFKDDNEKDYYDFETKTFYKKFTKRSLIDEFIKQACEQTDPSFENDKYTAIPAYEQPCYNDVKSRIIFVNKTTENQCDFASDVKKCYQCQSKRKGLGYFKTTMLILDIIIIPLSLFYLLFVAIYYLITKRLFGSKWRLISAIILLLLASIIIIFVIRNISFG